MGVSADMAREPNQGPLGGPGPRVLAAADLVAGSPLPMLLAWGAGPERLLNDACLLLGIGDDRRDASGAAWERLRAVAGDAIDTCFGGAAASRDDQEVAPGIWCNLHFTPVHEGEQVAAVLCTLVDTTEQVLAQRRLARLEQEARQRGAALSAIHAQMEEAAFHLRRDSAGEFRMESVNDAFCALTGLARGQVAGRRVDELFPQAVLPSLLARLREAIDSRATVRWEEAANWPSGARTCALAVTPTFDAQGQVVGLAATMHDLTRARELEQELGTARAGFDRLARDLHASGQRLDWLLARADLLAKLAQQVPGALFQLELHPDGRLVCPFISDMSRLLFDCEPAEIESSFKCLLQRIPRRDRVRLRRAMRESARRLQAWHAEFQVELPDGRLCWRELSAKPLRKGDGTVVWDGFISDITERKRTEATIRQFNDKLARRAHYDPLTGLPNRMLFRDRLELEMRHASAERRGVALLFIDLDRFKEVNDLLGHDAGDALLAYTARRIEGCVQPGDTVARLGGDEFAAVLTAGGEVAHAELVAQRIIDALRAPFRIGEEQVNVSASIGITLYPADGDRPEELMRNADQAMYRAKASGRNRLAFFEAGMQAAAMRRLRLANELRRAVADDQLQLLFQPILDIRSGQIAKAEALLRWRRPGHELALPHEFIGIAEDTGLIHDIGAWVFQQAARWAQRWSELLGRPFQVSINESPVEFQPDGHKLDWGAYLRQHGMLEHSIAVEVSEGLLQNLSGRAVSRLHELQQGGIEVSIDDFGTGCSSLAYLKRLAIDYLKIDKSFVAAMPDDPTSRTIIETIIVMAHRLGLKVIAEGVETDRQRDWLADHGCDYLQGFLFAPPLEAQQFEQMLARQPFAPAAHQAHHRPLH